MKTKHISLQIFFFLTAIFFQGHLAAEEDKKECILILAPYTDSSPLSSHIIRSVIRNMPLDYNGTVIRSESLSLLMINSNQDLEILRNKLFEKYDDEQPLLIIMESNACWAYFHEEIEKRWGDVPVILCTDKEFMAEKEYFMQKSFVPLDQRIPLEEIEKGRNLTIVNSPVYIRETIDMMHRHIPDMKELIFISDRRWANEQNRWEVEQLIEKEYPDLKLTLLTGGDLTADELLNSLRQVDEHSGILFSSWYQHDVVADNIFLTSNIYQMVSLYTPLPVFTLYNPGISDGGLVGGYVTLHEEISQLVAEMALAIVHGKSSAHIPSVTQQGRPVYNYKVMQEKGFTNVSYPKDTFFYSRPDNFFEKYRYYWISVLILILTIIAILGIRIKVIGKIRRIQQKELDLMRDYNSLFNNMPITYTKCELIRRDNQEISSFIFREVNRSFESHFLKKEDVLGKDCMEVIPGRYKEFISAFRLAEQEQREIAFQYYHTETSRVYTAVINLSAQQGYMDMFGIEMTELAETQQLLRTVNHKLTMALDVANIVPWKWDLVHQTILCDVNKPLELSHSTGEGENQLSVPDHEYFSRICKEDRPRIEQAYRNLIEKRVEKIKEEYRVLTYEEGVRKIEWVEAQAAVDRQDENGQPLSLIGSSLVITDRKKMESDLIAAKEKAEESNRLKSAFLANMSHEIRTPLNSIIGFSGILAATEDAEEKREYVSIIENNNTLLLQLINDILDISKIEAGTLEFIYSNIDLNEMMREIEQATRLRIASDKVDLVFEKRLPDCFINTERNRITQVLNNFLSNAIKFTNEGSIRFGYEMQGNNYLRFYVTDTGCGIPEDKIKSIFGRFVKLNNFKQGVGLGLSICETIINHMRGEIGVTSKEGEGSTFWFTLPYRPIKISENQVKAYKQIKVQREELTILIAEDNQNSFRLLESILQNEYKILHAWNGQEAVELYKKHNPHLILMDINMPVMDGYEATKEIRNLSDSVPILAITAYAYSADKERILSNGFDGYASKPLDATEIRYKIADMIRRQMIFI